MMLSAKEYKKSESLSLDKGWEFAQVGRNEWLPATVPGRREEGTTKNRSPDFRTAVLFCGTGASPSGTRAPVSGRRAGRR